MAFKFVDRARMSVSGTPGTGTIAPNVATSGAQSFAAAGVSDGDTFSYLVEDTGFAWELGDATYSATGPTITRSMKQSSTGSLLSLTSNAVIGCSLTAEHMGILGDARSSYVPLTFGSTVTIFGISGVYKSDQSFALVAGSRFDVEAMVYRLNANGSIVGVSVDGTTGYATSDQNDGNQVFYYYVSNFQSLQGNGSNSNYNWTGMHEHRLKLNVISTSRATFYGNAGAFYPALLNDTHVNIVGSANIYVQTDDITQCSVKARVAAGGMF